MAKTTSSNIEKIPVDPRIKFVETVRDGENKSNQGGIPSTSTTWQTSSDWDKFVSNYINKCKNFQVAEATSSNPEKTPLDPLIKFLEAVREGESRWNFQLFNNIERRQ